MMRVVGCLLATAILTTKVAASTAPTWVAGAEIRVRHEHLWDNLWGEGQPADDGYLLLRTLPHAQLSAGPWQARIQAIAATARGLRPTAGPADETGVDLLVAATAWDLVADDAFMLRATGGRELLSFGSERLVSRRYGANVPQAFQGARVTVAGRDWHLDLFKTRPIIADPGNFDDGPATRRFLDGAYATLGGPQRGLDLYHLRTGRDDVRFTQGVARDHRHTTGLRLFGQADEWSWNWEAIWQGGRFGDADIRAWSLASETGYRVTSLRLTPRLLLRANIASGDQEVGDGRLGTFNPLFPKAKYFGELTPVGPRNIMNLHPGLELELGQDVALTLAGMFYWRQRRGDGIYDVPGRLLRPAAPDAGRYIGHQGEVTLGWSDGGLSLAASFSAFAPGTFLRATGSARTIVMTGVELGWSF